MLITLVVSMLLVTTIILSMVVATKLSLTVTKRKVKVKCFEEPVAVRIAADCWDRTNTRKCKDSATYSHVAVAADSAACSKVGVETLKKGGSAVDAAIAAQLCLGVVNLHSTGIGGGGYMVYYDSTSGESYSVDFRGVSSLNASTNMYSGTEPDTHMYGGLSIVMPGEIRGLEHAWKKFGHLEWADLFLPAIQLARDGFPISKPLANAIAAMEPLILSGKYPGLQELLAPNRRILTEGDILKRPLLAQTLQDIAHNGADYFYSGHFMEKMVEELQEYGSIVDTKDFEQYQAVNRDVTITNFKGHKVHSIATPGEGPVIGQTLNILDGYDFDDSGLSAHRMIEAMKYTYAQRLKLGDPDFDSSVNQVMNFMLDPCTADSMRERINDNETFDPDHYIDPFASLSNVAHDHGTSHLSVLAENGDAVALTGSINSYFGSLIRSRTSGIIFNNIMADFTIAGRHCDFNQAENNHIEPGKQPISSMTPTIVTNDEGVKLVLGASGGSRITTAVAQIIVSVLGSQLPLNEAIYKPRLHHQLIPNQVSVEADFPSNLRDSLESRGHKVVNSGTYAVVQGIHVVDGLIHATSDPRKGGKPNGY